MLHVNTLEYYKFLYPQNKIYSYIINPNTAITQFAPFVISHGEIQKIHVIYVDHQPVYFSWSNNYCPYSFRISEGYHKIGIRTTENQITIDSVYFPKHKKLIMSVNKDALPRYAKISEISSILSEAEKNNLYKYIFPFKNVNDKGSYIINGANIFDLSQTSSENYNYKRTLLAGPVAGQTEFRKQ